MTTLTDYVTILAYGVGLLGISGGVFSFLRYDNYKTTVKLQNDNIKALQDQALILTTQLEESKAAHTESIKAMSKLEGKLESYKEIPLRSIAESLAKLAISNDDILSTLKGNNNISNDAGLLVKTSDSKPV